MGETLEEAFQGSQFKGDEDEENVDLLEKKCKDMSKVKWFSCHNIFHYAR